MDRTRHLQSAFGWALVGYLLTEVLIELVGFASPFAGLWLQPGEPGASRALLQGAQVVVPWFAVVYLMAAWHLARTVESTAARIGVLLLGALVPAAHLAPGVALRSLDAAESVVAPQTVGLVNLLAAMVIGLAVIVFLGVSWRGLGRARTQAGRIA
jgi:hypothetical protein